MRKSIKPPEPKPGKTLLLTLGDDKQLKIQLPIGSRVTFGPTIPYKGKGGAAYHTEGYSLRVYETAKNDSLIAVFCDVKQFRDVTMPCAKLIIREAGNSIWKSDEDGYKFEKEVKVEKSFENLKQLGNDTF